MKKLLFCLMLLPLIGMGWLFPHDYGCPAGNGGGSQPDVKAQFIFEDNGPNIVDEVSNLTLEPVGTGIEYKADTSSYSRKMDHGVKIPVPGVSAWFKKEGDTPQLDLGTNDATFEFVYKAYTPLTDHNVTLIETLNAAQNSGYRLNMTGSTSTVEMTIWATDGTVVQARWVTPKPFTVGDHKIRLVLDRDGNQLLKVDGEEIAGASGLSMAAIAGKEVKAHNVVLGGRVTGGFVFPAIWNEFRLSGNATNNSGGLNGG